MRFSENLNLPILQDGDKYSKEIQNEAFNTIDKECTNIKNTIKSILDINDDVTDAIKTLGNISEELSDLKEKQNEDYYELLESNNYIGNKITDIDSQLDTIKTNKVDKEEGKQLSTNDFDNNLLALLRSWEEFKTNGGEIGGDITLSGLLKFNDNVYVKANNNELALGSNGKNQVIMNTTELRPTSNEVMNLGADLSRWKDLWLGDYSKNTNGYTKLPNGLILQWGLATIKTSSGGGKVEVTYPISFPNSPLAQSTQIKNCGNDYTATRIVTIGRAWRTGITILAQQVSGTIITDNTNCEIGWIALGY